MNHENRIQLSLFLLRLGVFIVMFIWTVDKFVRPDHAAKVYKTFYFIGDLGPLESEKRVLGPEPHSASMNNGHWIATAEERVVSDLLIRVQEREVEIQQYQRGSEEE